MVASAAARVVVVSSSASPPQAAATRDSTATRPVISHNAGVLGLSFIVPLFMVPPFPFLSRLRTTTQ